MKKPILFSLLGIAAILSAFTVKYLSSGVDTASMDKKVNPGEDFFQFVNGNWIRNNPIPAAEARWGSFIMLAEQNTLMLKTILENATKDTKALPGSNVQKIGDFWKISMDTLKLEREGVEPAMKGLNAIQNAPDKKALLDIIAQLHGSGTGCFFGSYVTQDVKNNERNMVWFSQGGLGLPDRDYYLKQDEKSKRIRNEYVNHITKMYTLFGIPEGAEAKAVDILAFETGLAGSSMSRVENRNMEKKYNLRTFAQLSTDYPNIPWKRYFDEAGYTAKQVDTIILAQPAFFAYLNKSLDSAGTQTLKNYLVWKYMSSVSSFLNEAIGKQTFTFYGTVITGTKEQKPRWKRMVGSANGLIGEILAQEYVKVAFSESSKKRVNQMVDNLREAYRERIKKLDWMSPETKQKAMEKLASFNRKLGYPDKWEDYSKLDIKADNYLNNYFRAQAFGHQQMIDKLGKPIDKTEWGMLPQTVNAYYSAVMNEIVFPAAIMQPPFFDPNADDAVNYGAIGAVIGHEFSHGFDDQGSKYDAKGNLNSWWTEEDRKKFEARTKVIVNQYNQFKVADSVFVNGELTLGENIADIAGLLVAYDAFQLSLKGKPRKMIDGFTPEQRFFIGFAQVWRGHSRPEYVRNQVLTDPHSPQEFRVRGTLRNMPAFYKAFNVKSGQAMYLPDSSRVHVW